MHTQSKSFHLPQYESAILKKQHQSRILSPKVTQMYPEIREIHKLKIKRHHLDDTEVKQALSYDYQESQQPRQYLFTGNRVEYDRREYVGVGKGQRMNQGSNAFGHTSPNQLNLNSQYFQNQQNYSKPQRDTPNISSSRQAHQPQAYPSRLRKSISTSDFQSLRKDQHQMQQKVLTKLEQLEYQQNQRKNILLQERQQKSAHQQSTIARYKSQCKSSSGVEKEFVKLKNKLQRQRTLQKERLQNELKKIKQEGKRLRQQERQRTKSFKQLITQQQQLNQHQAITPAQMNNPIQVLQAKKLIAQKLHEIQKKYMPKVNVVNKRVQCEIYDPRAGDVRRWQEKPPFACGQQEDTDSQFSDY